jgi:tetratricopeptide (TPR) repeat protein
MKKVKLNKKQIITIASVAGIVLLAAAAGVIAQLVVRQTNDRQTSDVLGPMLPAVVNEAQELRDEGKGEEADKKIDEALASEATSQDTRYMLYIQQGHGFYDKQDWPAAIDAYLKAEAINATLETSELLADTYRSSGDNPKAIEYYKKAITLIPQDNPRRDAIKEGFEIHIRDLGGQP